MVREIEGLTKPRTLFSPGDQVLVPFVTRGEKAQKVKDCMPRCRPEMTSSLAYKISHPNQIRHSLAPPPPNHMSSSLKVGPH